MPIIITLNEDEFDAFIGTCKKAKHPNETLLKAANDLRSGFNPNVMQESSKGFKHAHEHTGIISMNIPGELWIEGLEYFKNEDKFIDWLRAPNIFFDGESPSDYCINNYNGDLKVRDLINRMANGMTA